MPQPTLPPRLSAKETIILEALASRSPMYGLELVTSSNGKLKRGTIYVTLARMEDKGYLESATEPRRPGAVGLPRRLYRPTAFGLRVLSAWAQIRSTLAWEPADGRRSP